uniref:Polyprotein n=1 Tax=La Herreria hepevirus TaxID=2797850 RepID=A0A7T3RIW3_9VIRU|nr:polyprotein [La Herreria hepevirus]
MDSLHSKEFREKHARALEASHESFIRMAIKPPFILNDEQFDILQSIYHPRLLIPTNTAGSSHPIAASLLYVANEELESQRGPNTIEIGPNVKLKNVDKNAVNSFCDDDGRDEARNIQQLQWLAAHNPSLHKRMQNAYNKPEKCGFGFCFKKIQNCAHFAQHILSVHSAYDIPIEDWIKIFDNTKAYTATLVMFLPAELTGGMAQHAFYNFRLDKGKAYFTFPHDTSIGYIHNFKNWKKYLDVDIIKGPDFNILLERVSWQGPQCKITMRRITQPVTVARTYYPYAAHFVRLPDVISIVETGIHDKDKDMIVSRDHAFKLYHYIRSLDQSALTTKTVQAYARGMVTSIKFGGVVRTPSWKIQPEAMDEAVRRILYIAMAHRAREVLSMTMITKELHRSCRAFIENLDDSVTFELSTPEVQTFKQRIIIKRGLRLVASCGVAYLVYLVAQWVCEQEKVSVTFKVTRMQEFMRWIYNNVINRPAFRQQFHVDQFELLDMPEWVQKVINNAENVVLPEDYDTLEFVRATPAMVQIARFLQKCVFFLPSTLATAFLWPWISLLDPRDNSSLVKIDIIHFDEVAVESSADGTSKRVEVRVNALSKSGTVGAVQRLRNALLKTPDSSVFRQAAYDAADALNIISPDPRAEQKLIVGVPGGGKTRAILSKCDPRDTSVIVPTQKMKEEYKIKGFDSYTFHRSMTAHLKPNIVVDEAFTFPLCFLQAIQHIHGCKSVTFVGDPHQIGFIDFEMVYPDNEDPEKWLGSLPTERMAETYRCPKDVTYILNSEFGYEMESKSKVDRSITYHKTIPAGAAQNIVFTQAAKKIYPSAITVHESQGSTYDVVNLILTDDSVRLRKDSSAHLIVGITRHANELRVVNRTKGEPDERIFTHEFINNLHKIDFATPFNMPMPKETVLTVESAYTPMHTPARLFGADALDNLLESVVSGHQDWECVTTHNFDEPYSALTMAENFTPEDTTSLVEKLRMKGLMFDHTTYIKQPNMVLNTLISRYAKQTKNCAPAILDEIAERVVTKFFESYVDPERFKLCEFPKLEDQNKAIFDQLDAMLNRQTDVKVEELNFDRQTQLVIDFFIKQQHKAKFSPSDDHLSAVGSAEQLKAGQGISAWSKTMNGVLGNVIRDIQSRVPESFRDRVHIVNGINDVSGLNMLNIEDMSHISFVESDFSEFDSGQNDLTLRCEEMIMRKFHVPESAIFLYVSMRKKWKLSARDVATLYGAYKQHSGQPATLFGNSLVTLLIIAEVCDVTDALVLVKGDDCCILGKESLETAKLAAHNMNFAIPIKEITGRPPQFINYFLTPYGPVPDLLRMLGKIKSKPITKDVFNIRESALLKVVKRVPPATKEIYTTDITDTSRTPIDVIENNLIVLGPLLAFLRRHLREGQDCIKLYLTRRVRNQGVLKFAASILDIKIIVYIVQHATIAEYLTSVRDRLRIIDTQEKAQAAYICGAKYYDVTPDEIEACHNWLHTFANLTPTEALGYYEPIRRPIISISAEPKSQKYKKYYFRTQDMGSENNDCLDRCILGLLNTPSCPRHRHREGDPPDSLQRSMNENELWFFRANEAIKTVRRYFPIGEMIDLEIAVFALRAAGFDGGILNMDRNINSKHQVYYVTDATPMIRLYMNHYTIITHWLSHDELHKLSQDEIDKFQEVDVSAVSMGVVDDFERLCRERATNPCWTGEKGGHTNKQPVESRLRVKDFDKILNRKFGDYYYEHEFPEVSQRAQGRSEKFQKTEHELEQTGYTKQATQTTDEQPQSSSTWGRVMHGPRLRRGLDCSRPNYSNWTRPTNLLRPEVRVCGGR